MTNNNAIWAAVVVTLGVLAVSLFVILNAPSEADKDTALLFAFAAPTITSILVLAKSQDMQSKLNGHLQAHVDMNKQLIDKPAITLSVPSVSVETSNPPNKPIGE